jgi:predicted RNA-binding protein (virulence factor B family)
LITPGTYSTFKIGQPTTGGVLLTDGRNGAVLLPKSEWNEEPVSGRYLNAFIYQNNAGTLVATLKRPFVALGEAACLAIKSVTHAGAFADWGIGKDIFIPFKEQHEPLREGHNYVITLYWDGLSERLAGSTRLNRHLKNEDHDLEKGQHVEVLIADKSRLGVNVVINKRFLGLVYHNEFFTKAKYGETTKGFIKEIRENNKIDVGLQKEGYAAVHDGADVLLTALESNRGFLALTDKSDPEVIKSQLGISKKVFKKALGQLYRQRIVQIKDDGIHLTAGD